MLYHPHPQLTTATLVGIDPGSESLGCAVLTFDVRTLALTSIVAQTFKGSHLPRSLWIADHYGDRISRIRAHYDQLRLIYQMNSPVLVACESPFMNLRRPQAYGALTEVVSMIRSTVIDHDWFIPFSLIDPPTVKMAVGAKGNADKEAVLAAMKTIQEITSCIDCSTLDEHSIDAIAVGYCALVRLRINGLSQIEHVY